MTTPARWDAYDAWMESAWEHALGALKRHSEQG